MDPGHTTRDTSRSGAEAQPRGARQTEREGASTSKGGTPWYPEEEIRRSAGKKKKTAEKGAYPEGQRRQT